MDRSVLQCKAVCSVGELSWHSTNCYWRPWVDFPIANALEVLIHFDMLIRGHYARNEIKWQREVICLSVNWVFLAGGVCFFFLPFHFLSLLHLNESNEGNVAECLKIIFLLADAVFFLLFFLSQSLPLSLFIFFRYLIFRSLLSVYVFSRFFSA